MKRKSFITVIFFLLAFVCLLGALTACEDGGGNNVTVTLDASGGQIPSGTNEISLEQGAAVSLPVPEREDYIFAGWFNGSNANAAQVTNGTLVTEDMTLTARWTADFSEGLEYALGTDGASYACIGSGTFAGAELKIPTFYEGMPVTAVADGAFADNALLTQVSLPRLMTSVGNGEGYTGAFENCTKLKTVTFRGESGLTLIGDDAFRGCGALEDIVLPAAVESIGQSAFYACDGLTGLVLPAGVSSVGGYAFYDCDGLSEMPLPDGLESIGNYAFSDCDGLTEMDVPDTVTSVGEGAFADCSRLTVVTLPAGLERIEDGLFQQCVSLERADIPDSVTYVGASAFSSCQRLTEIVLPDGLKSIGDYAFYRCDLCTDIVVPYDVNEIGESAFRVGESGYIWNNALTVWCEAPFQSSGWNDRWNPSGKTIWYYGGERGETSDGWQWMLRRDGGLGIYGYMGTATELVIPEELSGKAVKSIEIAAFSGNTAIQSAVVPNTVEEIGFGAFYGCSSLTSLSVPFTGNDAYGSEGRHLGYIFGTEYASSQNSSLPSALTKVAITGGTSIGTEAFMGCSRLTEIVLADTITSIGTSAFEDCWGLTQITLPDGLQSLGSRAFNYCQRLQSIVIPGGVQTIGVSTFSSCKALTTVILQEGVRRIREGAFINCYGLTSIVLPSSIETIESSSFLNANSLQYVYYGGTASSWANVTDNSGRGLTSKMYYYSETEPPLNADGTAYDGRYWRYENGLPAPWVKQEG